MSPPELVWFEVAERESQVAEELAQALQEKEPVDFTRLKVALGCMVAALLVSLLPLLKPSPKPVPAPSPSPIAAVQKAPAVAEKRDSPPQPKKKAKRPSGKIVARK